MFTSLILTALTMGQVEARQIDQLMVAENAAVLWGQTDHPDLEPAIDFDVISRTTQAVTGWVVEIEIRRSDNSLDRQGFGINAMEGYRSAEPGHETGAIPPNGMVHRRQYLGPLGGLGVASVRLKVVTAIFADGSWVGDRAYAEEMFRFREKDYQAWSVVVASLRAGRAAGSGHDALRAALQSLEKDVEDRGIVKITKQNLQMALDRPPYDTLSADEYLDEVLRRAEAHLKAVDANRHAKTGLKK
jgi:hypothetical protein